MVGPQGPTISQITRALTRKTRQDPRTLQPTSQKQYQQDHDHEAEPAAGIISPRSAVWSRRQRSEQQHHKYDQ